MAKNQNIGLNRRLLDKIADVSCHGAILEHLLNIHSLSLSDLIYFARKMCEVLNLKGDRDFDNEFIASVLEILWAVASREIIENEPALLLLHCLFTFVRNEKLTIRLLKQALITINQLLKPKETLAVFRKSDKNNETIDFLGKTLPTIGDFEAQAVMLEAIFRCTDSSSRQYWARKWFNDVLCSIFLSFNLAQFEADCRKFLMALNDNEGERKRVYSFVADSIILGEIQIREPRGSQLWVDFNLGSKSLSFYCEEISNDQPNENSLWETIILSQESTAACSLSVGENKCQHLQMRLHHPCSQLLSSTLSATEEPPLQMKGSCVDLFFNESLNIHPFITQIFGDVYLGQRVESSQPQVDAADKVPISFPSFHSSGGSSQTEKNIKGKASVSIAALQLKKLETKRIGNISTEDNQTMKAKISMPLVPLGITLDKTTNKKLSEIPKVEIKARERSIADLSYRAMPKASSVRTSVRGKAKEDSTKTECTSVRGKEAKEDSTKTEISKSMDDIEQQIAEMITEQNTKSTPQVRQKIPSKKVKTPIPLKFSAFTKESSHSISGVKTPGSAETGRKDVAKSVPSHPSEGIVLADVPRKEQGEKIQIGENKWIYSIPAPEETTDSTIPSRGKSSEEEKNSANRKQIRIKENNVQASKSNDKCSRKSRKKLKGTFHSDTDTSSEVSWLSKKVHLFETPKKTYFKSCRSNCAKVYYEGVKTKGSPAEVSNSKRKTRSISQNKAQKKKLASVSPYNVEAMLDEANITHDLRPKRKRVQKPNLHKVIAPAEQLDWKEIDEINLLVEKEYKTRTLEKKLHSYNFRNKTNKSVQNSEQKETVLDIEPSEVVISSQEISTFLQPIHSTLNADEYNATKKYKLDKIGSECFRQKSGKVLTSEVNEISPIHNEGHLGLSSLSPSSICPEKLKARSNSCSAKRKNESLWQEVVSHKDESIEKGRNQDKDDSLLEISGNNEVDMLENTANELESGKECSVEETQLQNPHLDILAESERNYNSSELSHMKRSLESYFKTVLESSPQKIEEGSPSSKKIVPLHGKKILLQCNESSIHKSKTTACPTHSLLTEDVSIEHWNPLTHYELDELTACLQNPKPQQEKDILRETSDKPKSRKRLDLTDDYFLPSSRVQPFFTSSMDYIQTATIPQTLRIKYEELSRRYVNTVQKYSTSLYKQQMIHLQNITDVISEMERNFIQSSNFDNTQRAKLSEKLTQVMKEIVILEEAEASLESTMIHVQKKIAAKFLKELEKVKEEILSKLHIDVLQQLRSHLMSFSLRL